MRNPALSVRASFYTWLKATARARDLPMAAIVEHVVDRAIGAPSIRPLESYRRTRRVTVPCSDRVMAKVDARRTDRGRTARTDIFEAAVVAVLDQAELSAVRRAA